MIDLFEFLSGGAGLPGVGNENAGASAATTTKLRVQRCQRRHSFLSKHELRADGEGRNYG